MFTNCEINGHSFKCLIDMGSSRTIIHKTVFDRCKVGETIKSVDINLKTATSQSVQLIGELLCEL